MHTSTISDQTDRTRTAPALRYDGAGPLAGIPSRNDIVAEFDNGMTTILQQSLSGKQPIHFMPTEVSDDIEGYSSYILRITGSLINGQKVVVNITGIRPFFDVEGYYTEKKAYIRIRTWNHFDRYNALKAVREVGIRTASDDLNCQYYYRKVAREERLPLSSWAVLSNYLYEFTPDGTYLFRLSVDNYNPISEDDYNNPLFSSALTRDRTLILTWDIETYSSRKTGE
ncbi:hypothetical protein RhiirA4_432114, partial [Rhizophagus irregularis]